MTNLTEERWVQTLQTSLEKKDQIIMMEGNYKRIKESDKRAHI